MILRHQLIFSDTTNMTLYLNIRLPSIMDMSVVANKFKANNHYKNKNKKTAYKFAVFVLFILLAYWPIFNTIDLKMFSNI